MDDETPAAEQPGTEADQPAETPAEQPAGTSEAAAPVEPPAPTPAGVRAERQSARTQRMRPITIAVVAAIVLVLLVVAGLAYSAVTKTRSAEDNVARAQSLIEQADELVLAIDEVVRSEVTSAVADAAVEASKTVPDARDDLQRAVKLLDEAAPALSDTEGQRAKTLRASAEARLEMLGVVGPILAANAKAARALGPADEGWTAAVAAEKLTDQAVANYNRLNKAGATASKNLNTQAQTGFKRSRELLATAEKEFPEADFEAYLAYVDGKLKLVAISLQSDDAYLRGNISGANSLAATYNAEEQKVIALAKKLPDSPSRAVANAFESVTGSATAEYFKARDKATSADARLRGQ